MPASSSSKVTVGWRSGLTTSFPSSNDTSTSVPTSSRVSTAKDLGIRRARLLPHFWIRVCMKSSFLCVYKEDTMLLLPTANWWEERFVMRGSEFLRELTAQASAAGGEPPQTHDWGIEQQTTAVPPVRCNGWLNEALHAVFRLASISARPEGGSLRQRPADAPSGPAPSLPPPAQEGA